MQNIVLNKMKKFKRTPVVDIKGVIGTKIEIDSPQWFKFLSLQDAFKYVGQFGRYIAVKSHNGYWYVQGENMYLGRTSNLLAKDLESADVALNKKELFNNVTNQQLFLDFNKVNEIMTVTLQHDQIKRTENETWVKLDVLKNLGIFIQLTL